ncbi:F-box/kelch-repeat protein At3g23880-like [Papaver somniferum]|uniref:F-box/kelch-repeat protein At3g23880-like n=1 Tax=Papaver somniferum TaxID=3469 RepID=UPI000E6F6500|nr:F-box/kelch-repeat protein At3g23880-like [Papaver somniferum]
MEKLGTDIVENILRRLPFETALEAKLVCKTWRILLLRKVGFLVTFLHSDIKKDKLCYSDLYDHIRGKMSYKYSYHRHDKMHGKFFLGYGYLENMLGSCNGLVCFERRCLYLGEPFLICNPFTGEVVYVPEPQSVKRGWGPTNISGFGYCLSINEYKIVRMYSDYIDPKKYHVQVYTVRSDEWRNIGSINIAPCYPAGTYANGLLYWLHRHNSNQLNEDYMIVAFDLEKENFQFIPLPRFKDVKCKYHLKLLGGNNLYLVCTIYDKLYCTDIWACRRKHINTACKTKGSYNYNHSWHWIKEFTIAWEEQYWRYLQYFESLAITRNNQFLLRYSSTTLLFYDLETSTLNTLLDGSGKGCNMINIIPHTNSTILIEGSRRQS